MKYQYKIVTKPTAGLTPDIVETALNTQGLLGWEVVNIFIVGTTLFVCLKKIIVK